MPLLPQHFVDPQAGNPPQVAVLQTPTHHPFCRAEDLFPGSAEDRRHFLPTQPPRPGCQKLHVALAQGALADRPRHRLHLHPAARAVHPSPRVHPKHGETPQRHVFIPACPGMVIRRPWLSTSRTPPPTPAPRPHLHLQTRPTRSRRPPDLLVHKALVIFDPIHNTFDLHPVPSCGIRVSSHYPLQDSDRMRKLILWPLPGSFAFSYPQILRKSRIFKWQRHQHKNPSLKVCL